MFFAHSRSCYVTEGKFFTPLCASEFYPVLVAQMSWMMDEINGAGWIMKMQLLIDLVTDILPTVMIMKMVM